MTYTYRTQGVCARGITFEIEDGIIQRVEFEGGCSGNTQGVARLAEGMSAADAVEKLRGIRCGLKSTSCPDQLAKALEQALANV
ncbi:MAG: TIGR03905 family TSCPD domain-containing protein [Clostridia bacterium]|nr:TIGR03905 family TSCPD domain-containing protein [Clostridia bacterium]